MAVKQSYFPKSELELADWLTNYRAKLPVHGPGCGVATAESTATTDDITFLLFVLSWHSTMQADLREATAYKRDLYFGSGAVHPLPSPTVLGTPPAACAPGALTRIQAQVQRIKNHSGYSEAIGEDLKIIGAADTSSHTAPEFSLSVEDASPNQKVVIKFKKFKHQGVYIEMRRPQATTPWTFLGVDSESPYADTSALYSGNPETREYRMRFWDKGEANGEWSAVRQVTVR